MADLIDELVNQYQKPIGYHGIVPEGKYYQGTDKTRIRDTDHTTLWLAGNPVGLDVIIALQAWATLKRREILFFWEDENGVALFSIPPTEKAGEIWEHGAVIIDPDQVQDMVNSWGLPV